MELEPDEIKNKPDVMNFYPLRLNFENLLKKQSKQQNEWLIVISKRGFCL